MDEIFEIWLRNEFEQATEDSCKADIWLRKNAQERLEKLQSGLKLLEEFEALPHRLTAASTAQVYGLYESD